MSDDNQILLSYGELIELLIKHNGIREGKWTLSIGFQIGVGLSGPSPDKMGFGPMIGITQIGIQRVPDNQTHTPGSVVIDAADVNKGAAPPKTARSPKASRKRK